MLEETTPSEDFEKMSGDLTRAKNLLVRLWDKHPAVRAQIEASTGPWFVWGQDRDDQAPAAPEAPSKPFAYYIYIAAEQRAEFVHKLDEALDDLTNYECKITELFDHATPAPALGASPEPAGLPFGIIDPDYATAYTKIRIAAWQYGYAIGLQGSFTRDLDLIAVPWTAMACPVEHLVKQIEYRSGLKRQGPPKEQPHGRLSWSLLFPGFEDPRWVDLSVVPLAAVGASVQKRCLLGCHEKGQCAADAQGTPLRCRIHPRPTPVGASVQPVPDGCAHDWKAFYTGPNHTHDICAKCEVKRPVQPVQASLSDAVESFDETIQRAKDAGHASISLQIATSHADELRAALASSTPTKGGEAS